MNILSLLTGGDTIINVVKSYIKKIFAHEAKKYQCELHNLKIVIDYDENGKMSLMTYSNTENKIWRIMSDEEVEKILTK